MHVHGAAGSRSSVLAIALVSVSGHTKVGCCCGCIICIVAVVEVGFSIFNKEAVFLLCFARIGDFGLSRFGHGNGIPNSGL